MRTDLPPVPNPTLQSRDGITVTLWDSATPRDLINDADPGGGRDLTVYTGRVSQSAGQADVTLNWQPGDVAITGANRPRAGQMVRIAQGGTAIFTGHIDAMSAERDLRGERSVQLTVRRRDATRWWRDVRRVTRIYSVGVDLAAIARDLADAMGLAPEEFSLPDVGVALAHDSAQLGDLSAWDMLELIGMPGLKEPLVDGRGILKWVDKNLRRAPDQVIPPAQVVSVSSSTARPPLTTMRVKWLEPALTRVDNLEDPQTGGTPVLTRSPLIATVGLFNPDTYVNVWWSEDHQQRADNTQLRVIADPRSGIGPLAAIVDPAIFSQEYTQVSEFSGRIAVHADVGAMVAKLIVDIAAFYAGSLLQSVPVVGGFFGGLTQSIALADALATVSSSGVGVYEITGVPFDYLHTVNETEAFDQNAEEWLMQVEELQNDLIPAPEVAAALAVNELLYRARGAARAGLEIAEDYRVEQSDIVALEDGRRFYVQDYRRDLTRGAEATLSLEGFFV